MKDTGDYHRSEWDRSHDLSALTHHLYSGEQLALIRQLIQADKWIEEERNDIGRIMDEIINENHTGG